LQARIEGLGLGRWRFFLSLWSVAAVLLHLVMARLRDVAGDTPHSSMSFGSLRQGHLADKARVHRVEQI